MEERKHLLDYLMRLFVCYGFTMLVMSFIRQPSPRLFLLG